VSGLRGQGERTRSLVSSCWSLAKTDSSIRRLRRGARAKIPFMDERELEAAAAELIEQERYPDAEDLLRGVHDEAIRNNQADLAICALQELIHIYVIQERLSDHERCQLEIEKLEDSAWSFVASSWFYLYSKQDFEAAIAKADRAIGKAQAEGDTSAAYTARAARPGAHQSRTTRRG